MKKIIEENTRAFTLLAKYLNYLPDYITKDKLDELCVGGYISEEEAYAIILSAVVGLDVADNPEDRALFNTYFRGIKRLDVKDFSQDPYYQKVKFPLVKIGDFSLNHRFLAPYELTVADDPTVLPNGRVIPTLGYFPEKFDYPAVFQGDRLWMSLLPTEITTTLPAVEQAKGKVLTYGLGLGYFAYRSALKEEVSEVYVVELSSEVITLFKHYILPCFGECGKKIKVIHGDAIEYSKKVAPKEKFDFVFADIWHDPSDGIDLYLKLKEAEKLSPQTQYCYWVEKTLKVYIDNLIGDGAVNS